MRSERVEGLTLECVILNFRVLFDVDDQSISLPLPSSTDAKFGRFSVKILIMTKRELLPAGLDSNAADQQRVRKRRRFCSNASLTQKAANQIRKNKAVAGGGGQVLLPFYA